MGITYYYLLWKTAKLQFNIFPLSVDREVRVYIPLYLLRQCHSAGMSNSLQLHGSLIIFMNGK
jgi:hypothetical protein